MFNYKNRRQLYSLVNSNNNNNNDNNNEKNNNNTHQQLLFVVLFALNLNLRYMKVL